MPVKLSCFRPIRSPWVWAHPGFMDLSSCAASIAASPWIRLTQEDGWRALFNGTVELWGYSLLSRGFVRGIVPFNRIDVFQGRRPTLCAARGVAPAIYRRVAERRAAGAQAQARGLVQCKLPAASRGSISAKPKPS